MKQENLVKRKISRDIMIVRNDKNQSLSRSYVYMKLTYVQRYFQENKNIILDEEQLLRCDDIVFREKCK